MATNNTALTHQTPVGEVRPSQLLWTYGPGALVDLPNVSVVTLGIDRWDKTRCQPIEEVRLLAAVRKVLGLQVESLRMPPFHRSERLDPWSAEAFIGVPVRPFPRWMRCVKCGLLSPFDTGLFQIKENRIRPERTRFVHSSCRGSKGDQPARDADAVPARFLLACRDGHLDDFPWHYFVHGGNSSCKGQLRFFESGASMQTENLWVKCDGCPATRSLAQAFGKSGKENLPSCRGRHPHLDHFDAGCNEEARAVLLGATNSWFPVTLSALAIPQPNVSPLHQIIVDFWEDFSDVEDVAMLKGTIKALIRRGEAQGIGDHDPQAVWSAIEAHRNGDAPVTVGESDIKGPEWDVLTQPYPPTDYPHFMSKTADTPTVFVPYIKRVLLLERLREVNALMGFTRVEAPEESGDSGNRPKMASLSRLKNTDWVPANQVHGEGIFIQFDEQALVRWEALPSVKAVDKMLRGGHKGWRNSRHLDPEEGYPGIRYAMLHTLSHILIRELALECGYNAASIRERIYADTISDAPQAGILIYTAAADSDGTLGGLVDLGKPESLGPLLEQALNRATICSSDPLCAEHDAEKDRSLHGAACHACSLVAETSCERGNRYLDRSLLIPTLERVDAAFFNVRRTDGDFSGAPGPRLASMQKDESAILPKGPGTTNKPTPIKRESPPAEMALRLSDLTDTFPSEPFLLRLITGSKVTRVRVRPVPSADIKAGQRVVVASPFLSLRSAAVSVVAGIFSISKLTDAFTDEPFILVSINGEGGLAQAKMPAAEWNSLKSIGLIEDLI
jgi:hypothetical protein